MIAYLDCPIGPCGCGPFVVPRADMMRPECGVVPRRLFAEGLTGTVICCENDECPASKVRVSEESTATAVARWNTRKESK